MKKRLKITVATLLLMIFTVSPLAVPALAATASLTAEKAKITVTFGSPAIPCDAGETVDLSDYSVEFKNGGAPENDITWTSDELTLDGTVAKPLSAGVYKLTASAKGQTKNVYLVAKDPSSDEYLLYYADFSDPAFDKSAIKPLTVSSGASWNITGGKLVMNASGSTSRYVRLAFTNFLSDFGDYKLTAVGTMYNGVNEKRWLSLVFRGSTVLTRYYHSCTRQSATLSNGVELAEHTDSGWNVTNTGAFTEKLVQNKFHTFEVEVNGNEAASYIDSKRMLYTDTVKNIRTGSVGLQVNGGTAEFKSFKVTLNTGRVEADKSRYASVKDPASNITLPPAVAVSDMTDAGKIIASGASSAVFDLDAGAKVSDVVTSLDKKVIPIFVTSETETARAAANELKRLDFPDAIIMSKNRTALSAARTAWNALIFACDMTDVTPGEFDAQAMSTAANEAGSRIIILSGETATRANVSALQKNFSTVFAVSEGTAVSDVSLITAGVNGIITPDPEGLISSFKEFFEPNTVARTVYTIAHRGLPTKYQENSVASFKAAYAAGATMVENDIQFSKDGVIVVMHDATIDRTTNGTGTISSMTWDQISKYQLCGDTSLALQPIPRLEDYFDALEEMEGIKLTIEIKSSDPAMITALVALIKKYDNLDKLQFVSFKTAQITELRRQLPGSAACVLDQTTTLAENSPAYSTEKILGLTQPYNAGIDAKYTLGLGEKVMKALSYRGIPYLDWTVNDKTDFEKCFLYGVTGITTNYADWMTNCLKTVTADKNEVRFEVGTQAEIAVASETYGHKISAANAEMVIIDGETALEYKDGVFTSGTSGETTVMFKVMARLPSGKAYYLYTEPVKVTAYVTGTSAQEETTPDVDPGTSDDPGTSEGGEQPGNDGCSGCSGASALLALVAVIPGGIIVKKKY